MDFENRIKKEMTEGIVKAILEDAGYRVIDSGIEKVSIGSIQRPTHTLRFLAAGKLD
nr:hypothetical protein [Ralstonia mannitolilytica]